MKFIKSFLADILNLFSIDTKLKIEIDANTPHKTPSINAWNRKK